MIEASQYSGFGIDSMMLRLGLRAAGAFLRWYKRSIILSQMGLFHETGEYS